MTKESLKIISIFLITMNYSLVIADSSLLPMYGGKNREKSSVIVEKDTRFITKAMKSFSSRKHAAEGYVERAFDMYSQNNFVDSMRRFNQAWLLDSKNAYIYLGYGLLYNNEKKSCKAMEMFMQAHKKGLIENGFLADYAYTITNCALTKDNQLQKILFNDANNLFHTASQTPNKRLKAFAYQAWAKSYFLQNDFINSQEMLKEAKKNDGTIDAEFENSLKEKIIYTK
jgi:hypothetical protein|tara:strand:- start:172 stop:855 length:684 start_codon:yes stop_codon:yes gene_type:complete